MELSGYLRILRKSWLAILALVLLGAAAGAVASVLATPKYHATTDLYVSVRTSDAMGTSDLVQGTNFARQAVVSYVDVATSAIVLDKVTERLELDPQAANLASRISANSPANTVLISITAVSSDPEQAALLANTTGEVFADVVMHEIEVPTADGQSPVQIKTIQPAVVPGAASSPNTPMNIALGALLGLALGVGFALLRSILDTRIHSVHDIEQVTSAPLLGGIAYDAGAKKAPLIVHTDPRNPRAEAFRTLRTNLQFVTAAGEARVFVMTSAVPSEGKSTTTANLAIALAETGASVVLVDGDLRKPRVADYMGIEGGVGLSDVLVGRAQLSDVLQRWGRNKLAVLPAGRIPPNPSELLGSSAMKGLVEKLSSGVDYVLIDAPPLLLVTDGAVVSKFATGAILAVAAGRTKRRELQGAVEALERIESRLVGIVATMLPTKGPDSNAYGAYAYGAASGEVYGDAEGPVSDSEPFDGLLTGSIPVQKTK